MKKNMKRIFVLLLVLAQLFVLCGCDALDELRDSRASMDENGNILWNSNTYKELPWSDYFAPDIDYQTDIYVTDPEVPLLLISTYAELMLSPNEDGNILINYRDTETSYYCIESMYDELSARIKAPFEPDKVCYQYDVYDEENYDFETMYYTLTQEQVDAVTLVTETVEPTTLGSGMYLDYQYRFFLLECSEDMLLQRNTLDIAISNHTYYLLMMTDEGELAFEVPEGCVAIFDEIVKAYIESVDYYYWDEELPADLKALEPTVI